MDTATQRSILISQEIILQTWEKLVGVTNNPESLAVFRKTELDVISKENTPLHMVIGEQFASSSQLWGPDYAEEVRSGQLVGYHILRKCIDEPMPRVSLGYIARFTKPIQNRSDTEEAKLSSEVSIYDVVWSEQSLAPPALQDIVSRFTKRTTRSGALFMFLLFAPFTEER